MFLNCSMLIFYQYHSFLITVSFTMSFNSWLDKFPFITHNFKAFWYAEKNLPEKLQNVLWAEWKFDSFRKNCISIQRMTPRFLLYVALKKILYLHFTHKCMSDLTSTFLLRLNWCGEKASEKESEILNLKPYLILFRCLIWDRLLIVSKS